VNYSDPFGLLAECQQIGNCTQSDVGLKTQLYNARINAEALEPVPSEQTIQNLQKFMLVLGMVDGASEGLAIGKGTLSLIKALEEAGPTMEGRIGAVSKWLPQGQKAIMTPLENGGYKMSGGVGARARQILMNPDGTTVVKAFNTTKKEYQIIKTITPPAQ
jgi:hypothetical protein